VVHFATVVKLHGQADVSGAKLYDRVCVRRWQAGGDINPDRYCSFAQPQWRNLIGTNDNMAFTPQQSSPGMEGASRQQLPKPTAPFRAVVQCACTRLTPLRAINFGSWCSLV
jgi:hypothetical protein